MSKTVETFVIANFFEASFLSEFYEGPIYLASKDDEELRNSFVLDDPSLVMEFSEKFKFQKTTLAEKDNQNFFWNANRIVSLDEKTKKQLDVVSEYYLNKNLWLLESDRGTNYSLHSKLPKVDDIEKIEIAKSPAKPHKIIFKNGEEVLANNIYCTADLGVMIRLLGLPTTIAQKLRGLYHQPVLEIEFEYNDSVGEYTDPLVVPNSQENFLPVQILCFPRSGGAQGKRIRSFSLMDDLIIEDKNEFAKRLRQIRRQVEKIFVKNFDREKLVVHTTPCFSSVVSESIQKEIKKLFGEKIHLFSRYSEFNLIQESIRSILKLRDQRDLRQGEKISGEVSELVEQVSG